MSTTEYGVNHPMAVKHWSADLMKEALKRTYALKFMGKDKKSLVQIKTELNKNAGDRIRFGRRVGPLFGRDPTQVLVHLTHGR